MNEIHHVAINVSDIKKSVKWYTTSFDCRLIYETAREAALQFANIRLVLILPSQEPGHLAIAKADASSFGELREREGGVRSTFVSDPTGNITEIVNV